MVRTIRKLPKEWTKYTPVGNVVAHTRFFAFKTPLRRELARRYLPGNQFSVPDLYRHLAFQNKSVGLVVNATNTERYYDPREIKNLGIEFQKLPSSGRSFIECESVVKSFIKVADDFLEKNRDNNLLIGVHCTDGVNRAGYLICRYLIDRLSMSSHDAINVVEAARGYTIERGALIQALHRADRTRRIRNQRLDYESEDDDDLTDRERRRKKRKQKEVIEDGFDMEMIQKMNQLRRTLNLDKAPVEAANNQSLTESQYIMHSTKSPLTAQDHMQATNRANYSQQMQATAAQHTGNPSETSSPFVDSQDFDADDQVTREEIDLETLGKIEVKEVSTTKSRRLRRKMLEKKFEVMKRGNFWEINEMNKS